MGHSVFNIFELGFASLAEKSGAYLEPSQASKM